MGNVILPFFASGAVTDIIGIQIQRILSGVSGIHLFLYPADRDSMQPAVGDNVALSQISDLSGNFLDAQITSAAGQEPLIQEGELNGQAILEFSAAEGDSLDVGSVSNSNLFHDGSPYSVYLISRFVTTPSSFFFHLMTRSSGITNGIFMGVDANTRTFRAAASTDPNGGIYTVTSGLQLALLTWYKIRLVFRGFNATLNDVELFINDVLEGSVVTSNDRQGAGNSQNPLGINSVGTLIDSALAMVLIVNNTSKSDAVVAAEHAIINDVINNISGL